MSDFAGVAAVTPAPGGMSGAGGAVDGGVVAAPEIAADTGESEGFDRDAALASLREGGDADEATEPAVEAEPEKSPEEQTEEERLKARKQKLSDDKGKLSQDKLDAAFAKLTAEGKRLRVKSEAFKAEKSAFEQAKTQYDAAVTAAAERVTAREAEFAKFEEAAKTSPLGVLEKFGWSVEKLVKFIQNDGKHSPEDLIKDTKSEYERRFEAQQKELEDLKSRLTTDKVKAAASQYEAKAIETMKSLIDGGKYELVKNYDLTTEIAPKVLQNIAHIYREGGELNGVKYPKGTALDPKVVLDYFEAQEVKAVSRHGFRPGQAGAANSAAKPGAAQPKALSNSDTSSRGVKPPSDDEAFDREAAWREVQSMLNG